MALDHLYYPPFQCPPVMTQNHCENNMMFSLQILPETGGNQEAPPLALLSLSPLQTLEAADL